VSEEVGTYTEVWSMTIKLSKLKCYLNTIFIKRNKEISILFYSKTVWFMPQYWLVEML
jgi:hypothetical protein